MAPGIEPTGSDVPGYSTTCRGVLGDDSSHFSWLGLFFCVSVSLFGLFFVSLVQWAVNSLHSTDSRSPQCFFQFFFFSSSQVM